MTVFRQLLYECIARPLALGVRLEQDGTQLQDFVGFIALHQAHYINTELALQWVTSEV